MTDASFDTTTTPKKKRKIVLPIIALIIGIVIIGFIVSRAGIDKALVKQKLDDAIAQIKEKGRAQGRDINITYGELDVVGGLTNRHVVIHDPALSIKSLTPPPKAPGDMSKPDSLVITTPVMEIYPEAVDFSALRVQLPQPINFAGQDAPEKSLMKVTANTPFTVTVEQNTVKNATYNKVTYVSPTEVDYNYLREQQAAGAEDATPTVVPVYENLHVTVAPASGVESNFAADGSQLGTATVHFSQVVMTPQSAPEGVVTIANITGAWTNQLNEQSQNVIHGTLDFGPVTGAAELLPYAPISLGMDVTYQGSVLKTPEAVAAITSQQSTIVVKKFVLSTKDASVSATANFVADAADVLPVGTASVAITNMPFVLTELRSNNLLTPANEPIVTPLLQLMTGAPVDTLKDVTIPIERTRGGAFKIGQTTFEELFATFLKTALKGQPIPATGISPATPSPHAPTLPPADKPKSKPIALPDNGVRG